MAEIGEVFHSAIQVDELRRAAVVRHRRQGRADLAVLDRLARTFPVKSGAIPSRSMVQETGVQGGSPARAGV